MNAYEIKRAKQWQADKLATRQAKKNIKSLLRLVGYIVVAIAIILIYTR